MQPRASPGQPRGGASPGLLRRRYSVPETIMRKYRLAQQRTDSESGVCTASPAVSASASPSRGSCGSLCGSQCAGAQGGAGGGRRELMRRSALLRRLWGRPPHPPPSPHSASLDSSRCDLRPPAPWASPKRQRLHSPLPDPSPPYCLTDSACGCCGASYIDTGDCTTTDAQFSSRLHSDVAVTVEMESESNRTNATPADSGELVPQVPDDQSSYTDTSDAFSTSMSTARESGTLQPRPYSPAAPVRLAHPDHKERNVLPFDRPLTVDTNSYELLEIVVSESINPVLADKVDSPGKYKPLSTNSRDGQSINIDEYVSNILVESLNSLTDQLESMSASIGNDRKISIVEKEIKVKLQNTGVNTIVHLSPTSNNQIIFGNEELYIKDDKRDAANNNAQLPRVSSIPEHNNNPTPPPPPAPPDPGPVHDGYSSLQHEAVNRAVLQQIQKLFKEGGELNSSYPDISHIEISNVDVYLNSDTTAAHSPDNVRLHVQRNDTREDIQHEVADDTQDELRVGAGNYPPGLVLRAAPPASDSMEVNTSSDTSLVDSLDDPLSPRAPLRRRRAATPAPPDLGSSDSTQRLSGEAFFVRIRDDECDCEKENVVVADHMPERIRQKLYRRHRRREQRMESARRSRVKQLRRDAERMRQAEGWREAEGSRRRDTTRDIRALNRDCAAVVSSLVDDVIARIALEEFKCMRIKQKGTSSYSKSDENISRRCKKKEWDYAQNREPLGVNRSGLVNFRSGSDSSMNRNEIHGKLSLPTFTPTSPNDRGPKRIYQKSEIHEGNKCIEILEILEYVNAHDSSPETTNSDDNQNHSPKSKKSRIPIPVCEKLTKGNANRSYNSRLENVSQLISRGQVSDSNRILANMLMNVLSEDKSEKKSTSRRASVPLAEPRSRSNSLKFKRVFDIIPEERSSISVESSAEDVNHNRRASAPNLPDATAAGEIQKKLRDTRNAATSPVVDSDFERKIPKQRSQITMTSPLRRTAATTPPTPALGSPKSAAPSAPAPPLAGPARLSSRGRAWLAAPAGSAEELSVGNRQRPTQRRVSSTQSESPVQRTVRTIQSENTEPIIVGARDCRRDSRRRRIEKGTVDSHERRSSYHAPRLNAPLDVALRKTHDQTCPRSVERIPEERAGDAKRDRSSSSESGSSLLCSLAPRWLQPRRRHRAPEDSAESGDGAGRGWSVTVAGSCRAALPRDVEMRLRFPQASRDPRSPDPRLTPPRSEANLAHSVDDLRDKQECSCRHCLSCLCGGSRAQGSRAGSRLPPAPPAHRVTLTMKKEAVDSSILASKSTRKSTEPLPDLETYRASRSKTRSSVKARPGYSLHCWLPEDELMPISSSNGLSVLGSAIVPELKPRVPTMSERDLTRHATPRLYLRS